MFHRYLTVLAPVGAVLMLIFMSLSAFNMMAGIAETMMPDGSGQQVTDVTAPGAAVVGSIGVLLFGAGMFSASMLLRRPTVPIRALLATAAVVLALSVCAIAFGNAHLNAAFFALATAESIQPEVISEAIERGKMPLLIGYTLLVVGATLVFVAGLLSPSEPTAKRSTMITIVASVSLVLLLLAGLWYWTSVPGFDEVMAQGSRVEPSQLARSVNGTVRSVFLSLIAVAGFAVTTLCLALAKPASEKN